MHLACNYRRIKVVKLFLRHHANINIKNLDFQTPLDYARDPILIHLLKKAGAKTGEDLSAQSDDSTKR